METSENSQFQMRSRAGRTQSSELESGSGQSYKDKVLIERRLKEDDTLNKIALQYHVTVAEIKRANNLVSDRDFAALRMVKIPISRMRQALELGTEGVSGESDEFVVNEETEALIHPHSRDPSVDEIFNKTDSNIAQVRHTLPESGTPGAFHFVDARPPESGFSVWMLLFIVVIIFILLPLILTFIEEKEIDIE